MCFLSNRIMYGKLPASRLFISTPPVFLSQLFINAPSNLTFTAQKAGRAKAGGKQMENLSLTRFFLDMRSVCCVVRFVWLSHMMSWNTWTQNAIPHETHTSHHTPLTLYRMLHQDLWVQLDTQVERLRGKAKVEWVKGHAGTQFVCYLRATTILFTLLCFCSCFYYFSFLLRSGSWSKRMSTHSQNTGT